MEHVFPARILAYSREYAECPTVLLTIVPEHAADEDKVESILKGEPLRADDSSFIWSEEPAFIGLSVWAGMVVVSTDTVEFRGRWNVATLAELRTLGELL